MGIPATHADHPAFAPPDRSPQSERLLNVVVAAGALVLLTPVFLLVALTRTLTATGPIFATQTRVGIDRRSAPSGAAGERHVDERRVEDLGGQPFTRLTFRTRGDAAASGPSARATAQGRWAAALERVLGTTHLAALPQLLNVLRGEMKVVGPRPERPATIARLRAQVPAYVQRHRVKPGITGWAQLHGVRDAYPSTGDEPADERVEMVEQALRQDLAYARTGSAIVDARILLLTLPVLLVRRGSRS